MAKRPGQEEELIAATSERVEGCSTTASEGGPLAVNKKPVTVETTFHESKVETPWDEVHASVAVKGMPGDGPFWDLLARAGYQPW